MKRWAVAAPFALMTFCGCAEIAGIEDWAPKGAGPVGSGASGGGSSIATTGSGAGGTATGSGGVGGCGAADDPENCGACGKSCLGGACIEGHCQPLVLVDQPGAQDLPHIALDEDSIFFVQDGAIMMLPKSVTSVEASTTLVAATYGADFIAVDDARVYWTRYKPTGAVGSIDKASKVITNLAPGQDSPLGLAISTTDVYWTLHVAAKLFKTPLDGTGQPVLVADTGTLPFYVALDGAAIYWTYQGTSLGGVSRFDGMTKSLASNHPSPSGLALDATNVYWLDYDGSVHRVAKGGGMIGDIAPPEGEIFSGEVRVDATHIYWTGAGDDTCADKPCPLCGGQVCTGRIWRALFDGPPEVFAEGDWHGARALVVDDTAVYWTTSDKRLFRKSKAAP